MEKTTSAATDPTLYRRILIFSLIVVLSAMIAHWVCLLRVLQPQHWPIAANIARWVWLVGLLFPTLFYLLGETAMRLGPSPRPPRVFNWVMCGLLISVATIIALLMGRFVPALLLSYGWSSLDSLRKWRLAPAESSAHLRRIKRIGAAIGALSFPLVAAALTWHSLPIAYGLFGSQIAGAIIGIPLFRDQYRQNSALLKSAP